MLATIIAHGLFSKGPFNTFLTKGLYDPRLFVNVIYPFQGNFGDASVDKFLEYVSYIAEINHLDYKKTYQKLMSENLSNALRRDNVELFTHIIVTKNIYFAYNYCFHYPYKRKCFEWCFKNLDWGDEIIRSQRAADYAYLLNEKQAVKLLEYKPEFLIYFPDLHPQQLQEVFQAHLHILYFENVRNFYKNLCKVKPDLKDPFIDIIIEYIELTHTELFIEEEKVLSHFMTDFIPTVLNRQVQQQKLEQALASCELEIIEKMHHMKNTIKTEFKQYSYSINNLREYYSTRLLSNSFQLNNERRWQIMEEILCVPNYYIYVCWLHKRYDIIYNLYYTIDLQFPIIKLPSINKAQFQLALPQIENNDMKYEIYTRCFINNRTDLVEVIEPLDKIEYHLLLDKISQLESKRNSYYRNCQTYMTEETKSIIHGFLQPSEK